jgi:hypothetical protein
MIGGVVVMLLMVNCRYRYANSAMGRITLRKITNVNEVIKILI